MDISNSKLVINDKRLRELESRFNIILPDEYRQFILINNGGTPMPNVFEFIDTEGKKSNSLVHYFLAIYDGNGFDNIEQNYLLYISEKRIPSDIFPIAEDPFGNMVCVSVASGDYGKVYFWDHELEFEDNYGNLSLIANSFNEFIHKLKENS